MGQGHFGIEYQRVMKVVIIGILQGFCGVLCGFWVKILIGESFFGGKMDCGGEFDPQKALSVFFLYIHHSIYC